jgi:alkyl hydroperoxide reductase subunit AhpC
MVRVVLEATEVVLMAKIFVIDDEPGIRDLLWTLLFVGRDMTYS